MSVVVNNQFFIGNQLGRLSRTGMVRAWHCTQYDMQGLGVACPDSELAGNSLTVAAYSRTGKVGVWHTMTQNWQVILSWWLHSVGQARSACGMP